MSQTNIDGPIIADWIDATPDGNGLVTHDLSQGSAIRLAAGSCSGIALTVNNQPLDPNTNQFVAVWIWSVSATTIVHDDSGVTDPTHRFYNTQGVDYTLALNPIITYWRYESGAWGWRQPDWNVHTGYRYVDQFPLAVPSAMYFTYRGPTVSLASIDFTAYGDIGTGLDATITPAINGVAVTNGDVEFTNANDGAGATLTATPTAANVIEDGDVVSFVVSGTNDTGTCSITLTLAS